MKKHINSATEQYQDEYTDNWVLDDTPTEGSFNAVTSDGVAKAIEQGGGGGTTYTAGDGISISDENVISADFSDVQAKLTAGSNISIDDGVISATDTTYTAGSNISIDDGVISATDTTYTAGSNISIDNGVISATDTTYTAGSNISINDGVISATDTTYTAGSGVSIANGEISADYTAVQAKLTAGSGIDITGNTISATGGGSSYSAGTGIDITSNVISVDTTAIATQNDLTSGLSGKQDTLTAGTGISISNNVISATGGSGSVVVDSSGPLSGDGTSGAPLGLRQGYGLITEGGYQDWQYKAAVTGEYLYGLTSDVSAALGNGNSIKFSWGYFYNNGGSNYLYPTIVDGNLTVVAWFNAIDVGVSSYDSYMDIEMWNYNIHGSVDASATNFVLFTYEEPTIGGTVSDYWQTSTPYDGWSIWVYEMIPVRLAVDTSVIPTPPDYSQLVPYHDSGNDGQVLTVDSNGNTYWNTPATIVGKGLVVVNSLPASPDPTYLYLVRGDGIYLGSTCVIKSDTIPVPPTPDPYTIRFQFTEPSYDPTQQSSVTWKSGSSWTQVVGAQGNVWEYSHNTTDWSYEFSDGMDGFFNSNNYSETGAIYIVSAYLGSVLNASNMFYNCNSIYGVTGLNNTGNITDVSGMFAYTNIGTAPSMDTTSVTDFNSFLASTPITGNLPVYAYDAAINVSAMFSGCGLVDGGLLDNYNVMTSSGAPNIQTHSDTFYQCGSSSASGALELSQIPASWGGTGA